MSGKLLAEFVVFGRAAGYYAQGKMPNYKRMKLYNAFKVAVQEYATASGINLPIVATKDRPLKIVTTAYFFNGVHPDPENVHKGVKDALFWAPRGRKRHGADKYTGGTYSAPRYDKQDPRVEVEIFEADPEDVLQPSLF